MMADVYGLAKEQYASLGVDTEVAMPVLGVAF